MDDPVAVEVVHPAQQLPHQVLHLVGREAWGRTVLEELLEVLIHVLEDEVELHDLVVLGAGADVQQPHDVGVVVLAEVAEERDLPQHVGGDPVLGHRDPHLLHRHE